MALARRRLTFSPSVFLMGESHVSLFLVTRDDLVAVAPHLALADENAASKHRKPRGERPAVRPVSDRTVAWTRPPAGPALPGGENSIEFEVPGTDIDQQQARVAADDDGGGSVRTSDSGRGASAARWTLTIAATVGGLALAGGLVALLAVDRGSSGAPAAVAAVAAAAPAPAAAPPPAPDADALRQIARPVQAYAQANQATAESRRSDRRPPRPRPRGRWLPNPIPGLPPIRLP